MYYDFFKSYIDNDDTPVVICDLNYKIIYVNPCAADKYKSYGGADLVGRSLISFMDEEAESKVNAVVEWFKESSDNNNIFALHRKEENDDVYMSALRDADGRLVGFCSRHRYRSPDTNQGYDIC